MNNFKNTFSIKDLENFSGIKAHTIRIWEKRYDILQPMRTDTNIRLYDLESLQKLLNITLLHNHGYKISTISKYPVEKIPQLVREIISVKTVKNHAISAFKIAMLNFDQHHFLNTYNNLLSEKSFSDIFSEVFLPLLQELGVLWQSETISAAQEHFISALIKQKLVVNIEKAQQSGIKNNDKVFVLYLPENEIHDLGLLYLNYEILTHGYQTIYLGQNIALADLKTLENHFDKVVFVSYFTVQPEKDSVNQYVELFNKTLLSEQSEFWITGKQSQYLFDTQHPKNKIFHSISELVAEL